MTPDPVTSPARDNADAGEIAKFDALAQRWWDPAGEFAPLHRLNPLRTAYVAARAPLAGARVLDVGCGGGLLAESLARAGAAVTAVDLSPAAIEVAELHALDGGLAIDYRCCAAESLLDTRAGHYDVVTCMEMLEHVPEPAAVLVTLARLVRPGGQVFVSTLSRNARSFALAIVAAEYVLGLVPRGTHEYARFINPSELARAARAADLDLRDLTGIEPVLGTREFRLGRDVRVNYIAHLTRPDHSAS
jgi:2-polyprenyl-6-hydroxyphenyl methylase/3-demethylubiquinone-9 3-methyltransferase